VSGVGGGWVSVQGHLFILAVPVWCVGISGGGSVDRTEESVVRHGEVLDGCAGFVLHTDSRYQCSTSSVSFVLRFCDILDLGRAFHTRYVPHGHTND